MALFPPATPQSLSLVFQTSALALVCTVILAAASGSGGAEAAQAMLNSQATLLASAYLLLET